AVPQPGRGHPLRAASPAGRCPGGAAPVVRHLPRVAGDPVRGGVAAPDHRTRRRAAPGAERMTRSRPADTGKASRPLLRPYAPGFAVVVVLQVIGAVAGLAPLLAVVELARVLLAPGPVDHAQVRDLVLIGAAGMLARLVFTTASSGVGHLLDGHVQLALRRALAARLGRVPLGWFSRRRTGELAKVVGDDVSAVHPFIAHAPGELVSAFVVPLVSLIYLITIDWRLTLVTLIPVGLALALVPAMLAPARLREQEEFDAAMGRI